MSYLERLRRIEFSEKRSPEELTKLTKRASVSSVSTEGKHFLKIAKGQMAQEWTVHLPDGRAVRAWLGWLATPAEVIAQHPGAASVEPYRTPPAAVTARRLIEAEETAIRGCLDRIRETDSPSRREVMDLNRQNAGFRRRTLDAAEYEPSAYPRAWEMLMADPGRHYAFEVLDPDSDPVRVTVAVRDIGTCDLLIARDRWDLLQFLELIEKTGARN